MLKHRYRTINWKQYNKALINLVSSPCGLKVKRTSSIPLRTRQWITNSVFQLANASLECPHYTCISRCVKQVEVSLITKMRVAIPYLAIDANDLQLYGESESKIKNTAQAASVESKGNCILLSIEIPTKSLRQN